MLPNPHKSGHKKSRSTSGSGIIVWYLLCVWYFGAFTGVSVRFKRYISGIFSGACGIFAVWAFLCKVLVLKGF